MIKIIFPTFLLLFSGVGPSPSQNDMTTYQVRKIDAPFDIDANWNKNPWTQIEALSLPNYMGDKPSHMPAVQAKLAYDEQAIYVIFRVEDQYVIATRSQHQEGVYKDSCVEFFFSPAADSNDGYFNLEMNCGGTMLFHHQKKPRIDPISISDEDIAQVQVAHSLPALVEPEIQEPTTWVVEYRIPFEILEKYHSLSPPSAGSIWRGNFYKCADESSHPHWLTWAPIDNPTPNFHLPAFFGTLKF